MNKVFLKALLFSVAFSSSAFAEDRLKARAEVNWSIGSERSIIMTEFWVPLAQDMPSGRVLYGDYRMMGDDQDNREFNLGIGYRQIVDAPLLGEGIVGTHGWFDRRLTDRGSHFNQVTTGLEWFSEDYEIKLNGYMPINDSKTYQQENPEGTNPRFVGSQIVVNTDQEVVEESLHGVDLELGYRLPFMDEYTDSTRVYAAGFHFEGDLSEDVSGWRVRSQSDITENIEVGARFQSDDVRGSQGFLEATIRFPFGNKQSYKTTGLRARLDDSPERDIDIISNEAITDDGFDKPLISSETNVAQNIIHVDNTAAGGGDGSNEARYNTLSAAEAAAGIGDIIYVHRGDGTSTGMNAGITIDDNRQKLIGSGVDLTVRDLGLRVRNNRSIRSNVIIAASDAPIITNGGGDGVRLLADNLLVSGITVDGVSDDGIAIENANNVSVRNVTVQNSNNQNLDFLFDDNESFEVTVSNSSFDTNTTGSNVFIDSRNDATTNITIDNTTVQNSNTSNMFFVMRNTSTNTISVDGNNIQNAIGGSNIFIQTEDTAQLTSNISRNTIDTASGTGIITRVEDNSSNVSTISRNEVSNSNSVNISYQTRNTGTGEVYITDNTTDTTTTQHGILIRPGDDSVISSFTVENNTVLNSNTGGITIDDFGSTTGTITQGIVRNNTVENSGTQGITASILNSTGSFSNLLFDGNTVINNGGFGVQFRADSGALSARAENNIITGNGSHGFEVNDDTVLAFTVDLGGGSLGSSGNNSVFSNVGSELRLDLDGGELKAENNWWGVSTGLPVSEFTTFSSSTVDSDPFLTTDPNN